MDALEGTRMSWRNVRDHPLRSTLTTLGVIIGVAAVITFVTLGASLQAEIVRTVAGEETNVVYVSAGSETRSTVPDLGRGGQAVFTERDVERLGELNGVRAAVPQGGLAASTVAHENDTVGRQWVTVTTPRFFDVRGHDFSAGRSFESGAREVVVNEEASRMFAGNVSVGDSITITRSADGDRVNATVVGIVNTSAGSDSSLLDSGGDPAIYAPPDPLYKRTVRNPSTGSETRVYARVLVEARSVTAVEAVQGRVYTYLGQNSDAKQLKSVGYELRATTHDQLVNQIRQISTTFTAYISGIAVISLVVGAIGIANIMLVSVTERTREIGIMKAIGATKRDVLQLFLTEAIMLGLLGSILGALLGIVGGYLATFVLDLPLRMRVLWFGVAVFAGLFVGVLSGLYPAWSAARTDPIEALRYE